MRIALRDGVADLRARKIWRTGGIGRLSAAEVQVLDLLLGRVGETVDRDEILVRALGHPPTSLSRAVDLCVHRLRLKLEVDPARPVHLITATGEGYRLEPASEAPEPRSNLPRSPDELVGRDDLVSEVARWLVEGPVALVGPAGVGKSAAAHRIGALARSTAPAGRFWVDAAAIADPTALAVAIAQAAALQGDAIPAVVEALCARGPSLLVLDTCERATEAVAAVVSAWTGGGLLLTSRLPVSGARSVEVPPLSADDAVRLLTSRAREVGFEGELPADRIRRVVEAVDRLPLGIELAAARLPAMSLARIEQELVDPLRLLRGRAPGRLASVEASVRWSWDGLDPADRERLVRIAVFRAPLPVGVAEAVIGVDAVQRLVRAYLLRPVEGRLTPWHAVGELALRLAPPETLASARRAHADRLADRARALVSALWTRDYPAALAELQHLEADSALAEEVADDPADLALARCELDHEHGRAAAVVDRVDRVLDRIPTDHPRRPALLGAGASALARLGRYPEAIARAEQAMALAVRPEDRVSGAYTATTANLRLARSEAAHAALATLWADAGDDPVLRARAWGAEVMVRTLDWPGLGGVHAQEEALRTAEEAGAVRVVALATHNLAVGYHRLGQTGRAEEMYLRSIERLQPNRRACGIAWNNLSILHLPVDPEASLRAAQEAVAAFSDAGSGDGQRAALGMSAMAHAALGEALDAMADADEAYDRLGGSTGPGSAQTRAVRAGIYATFGRAEVAAALFADLRSGLGEDLHLAPEDVEALVSAWTTDRKLEPERAVRLEEVVGDRRWIQVRALRIANRVG